MPSIDVRATFLSAESLAIQNGQSNDFDLRQRFLDRFQFSRLDNGDDQFQDSVAVGRLPVDIQNDWSQ